MKRFHLLGWVAFCTAVGLILLRLLIFRPSMDPQVELASATSRSVAGQRSHRASSRQSANFPLSLPDELPVRNDEISSSPSGRGLRQLTGYIVDDFRAWTSIPDGYRAEGIRIGNGGVTLDVPSDPEQTLSGRLESPPLPLRPPPGGRPDTPGRELPPGSSLELELRLSRDGAEWTGWSPVERYRTPDGPYVAAPPPPNPEELHLFRDATTTGPSIQYRLSLSVGSGGAPTLRDLRIWHEGPAQLEQDLSIHSPPKQRE